MDGQGIPVSITLLDSDQVQGLGCQNCGYVVMTVYMYVRHDNTITIVNMYMYMYYIILLH
jgi:hypothetical protein